jgi:hypothetical protein
MAHVAVDTWNSFAGVAPFDDLKPVKKFTSRRLGVARIWQAVARLSPDGPQSAAEVAPAKTKAKKAPTKAPRRARAHEGATESRANKKAEVIAMMKHPQARRSPRLWKRRAGRSTRYRPRGHSG